MNLIWKFLYLFYFIFTKLHFFFLISSCYVPTSLFGFFQLHRILAKNLYDFRYGRANELPWFVRLAVTNPWISLGSEMAFQFLKMKMPGKTKKETNKFGRRTYSSSCWYINGINWTTFSCYLSWETIPSSNIYWCDFFFFNYKYIIFFPRFTMVEHVNGEESVSRYLIAPILDQDGGEVVCEVTNRFGRDSKIFLLSIEGIRKEDFFCLQFEREIS